MNKSIQRKIFMQMKYYTMMTMTLFLFSCVHGMDQAKAKKLKEQARARARYYKQQAHDHFDIDYGTHEAKAHHQLTQRQAKRNAKDPSKAF